MKTGLLAFAGALKKHGLMAAAIALVGVIAGAFTAGPAVAQAVRAALVSNVDDPGRIPYHSNVSCSNPVGLCQATFPPVQGGKRLVITNVSVLLQTSQPGGTQLFGLLTGGGGANPFPKIYLAFSFAGGNAFVSNLATHAIFDGGQSPQVITLTVDGFSTNTIVDVSGYVLDCTTGPCAAIAP